MAHLDKNIGSRPIKPRAAMRFGASLRRGLGRLARNTSGISMVEFALVLPVLLTLGLYGAEISRMATTKMKVSQIALSLGDNASRLGQTDNSGVTPTITEGDVDTLLASAMFQGASVDLRSNSRVILTSLEYDDFTNRQFIAWQRCQGDRNVGSDYGDDSSENNGLMGEPLAGMGDGRRKITAASGEAVMFVEIFYEYDAMFENPFGSGNRTFKQEAAFLIRDDRNLGPGLTGTESGDSSCDVVPDDGGGDGTDVDDGSGGDGGDGGGDGTDGFVVEDDDEDGAG